MSKVIVITQYRFTLKAPLNSLQIFAIHISLWIPMKSMMTMMENFQPWPQDWKRSVVTPISKKGNAKECSS